MDVLGVDLPLCRRQAFRHIACQHFREAIDRIQWCPQLMADALQERGFSFRSIFCCGLRQLQIMGKLFDLILGFGCLIAEP